MILKVKIKPSAGRTRIIRWVDDSTVVIAVKTPAINNQANRELLKFLGKHFKIAKTLIKIRQGIRSRNKMVEIPEPELDKNTKED